MSLHESLLQLWEASGLSKHNQELFWKEDMADIQENNGFEPLDVFAHTLSNIQGQVVSDNGIALTHYRLRVPVPSIAGTRQEWRDYYEVWTMGFTPATREEPEDADPVFIAGSMGSITAGFLAFLNAVVDTRIQCKYESEEGIF